MNRHALASLLVFVPAVASAQIHTRGELIVGNTATFAATTPAGLFALFALSPTGTGPAGCIPGIGCIEVLPPILLSPLVSVAGDGVCRFSFVIPPTIVPGPLGSQAIVLEPGAFVLSNAIDGAIQPLSAFDDDFDGASLGSGWQIHNPHLLQHSLSGGELHVQPTAGGPTATWYADGEGPCVYRIVRGDFTVVASVRSYRLSDPSLPPPANYDMAGLTLRDPLRSDGVTNNWLHVAIGGGTPAQPIVVEDKSTFDSTSNLMLTSIPAPSGQVRITRAGDLVELYYRPDGTAPWQLLRAHWRPDLSDELQVGPNVFSWSPTVDVGASFDQVQFTRP